MFIFLNQVLHWSFVLKLKNFVREDVSDCSLCQVENERSVRNACFSQKAKPCQTQKLSQAVRTVKFKNLSKPITFQGATKRSLVCGRGMSERNPVRPAGKWAKGLICQTGKTPACHIQFVVFSLLNTNWFAHFCYY